jgi:oxygen-dependent protoporphyrinogen oxidase
MAQNYSYIILGAGIAGLSFAYKLKQKGISFLLVENSGQVGGNWKSFPHKNSIYEFGPNSFMNRCPALEEMIDTIGFRDQVISHSFKDSKRYLYSQNKLKAVGPQELILSDLLSMEAKLAILTEPFKRSAATSSDESIYDFISRRFNNQLADFVSYALQGIWAGDARQLSARSALTKLYEAEEQYGSVIGGMIMGKVNGQWSTVNGNTRNKIPVHRSPSTAEPLETCSFKHGMQSFCVALADWLNQDNILFNSSTKITMLSDHGCTLEINDKNFHADNLVIATKAFEAADLLNPVSPELAQALDSIYYAPISLYAYTLTQSIFTERGHKMLNAFGYINGTKNKSILGTIFSSQLFKERNLDDEYLFLSFAKPLADAQGLMPNATWELLSSELIKVFQPYANKLLELKDFNLVNSKTINRAIPQYNIGYSQISENIDKELTKFPRLTLVGNYRGGVSLADTIARAQRVI